VPGRLNSAADELSRHPVEESSLSVTVIEYSAKNKEKAVSMWFDVTTCASSRMGEESTEDWWLDLFTDPVVRRKYFIRSTTTRLPELRDHPKRKVQAYARTCDVCQRCKADYHLSRGLTQVLDVPMTKRESILMDPGLRKSDVSDTPLGARAVVSIATGDDNAQHRVEGEYLSARGRTVKTQTEIVYIVFTGRGDDQRKKI